MSMNAVLQLDNSLMRQIEDSESILIITVYFNDALFNEGGDSLYKNAAQVIGTTIFPEITELNGSFKFYYYKQENSTDVCAFWNYSVNEDGIIRGHWKKESEPTQLSPVSLCESKNTSHIAILEAESNVTSDLEDILNSNLTARKRLEQVATITTNVPNKLSPVDIYLIAKILDLSSEEADKEELVLATRIVSKLFHVPRSVLRASQVSYFATDRILHSIDEMAKVIDSVDGDPIVQDNFVVAVYDLKATNVSGLLMENCGTTQCNISTLENTVNLTQLAENENLETAIALSDSLLSQIQQSEGSPKLVTTVFFSDVLFNEVVEGQRNVSMICGLLLPGLEEPLNGSVFLMYNTPSEVDYNSCAYWNYNVTGGDQMVGGVWKEDADPITKKRFAICQFDHTTHFALLLANGNNSLSDADKYRILDIMTDINCMLSLIGILGILLTAALFERWRRNTGNQILVNFVVAISIKIVMLYVSVAVYSEHVADVGCSVTGAILHYAILSEFCWMLIIAILQFKRFVEVLGGPPKYILLKACICGWVFPVLPVTLILLVDADNYSEGQMGLCYPSGLGLYLGIWLPLIIIITINFVIFIFIIYNVFHKKTETRDLVNHEILFQWRLALLLFSMLGLTWLFGFLGLINGATIFIYLFCFTSTLQGFIMFLFFIVFNKSTRFLYAQAIKMWLYTKGYKMQPSIVRGIEEDRVHPDRQSTTGISEEVLPEQDMTRN
ncbi:hypothetical protein NQ318_013370 [Aromia moschata]|uniref:G-protein coupled receptors family 2 profile 2 domain-containing protein n=1 Tax=Aromia moschata TaxID=1265417 RepID=A0AAV8XWL3_9CUCU|nr:hypothetical protein NQ318_013370 [Aromia moschata]